jgi:hypothetical protein
VYAFGHAPDARERRKLREKSASTLLLCLIVVLH